MAILCYGYCFPQAWRQPDHGKEKAFTARIDTIRRLAREIKQATTKGNVRLLVGHGGGSFAHQVASEYRTHEGMINEKSREGVAKVWDAAIQLDRIVMKEFLAERLLAVSVSPSSAAIAYNGRLIEFYHQPLEHLLRHGIIPVVRGDVVLDAEKGCAIASTEDVFSVLAKKIKPSRIIMAGKTSGVYTADPGKNKSAERIAEITNKNFPGIRRYLTGSDGADVTGGMLHKVEASLALAKLGIETWIINGNTPGAVEQAILGKAVEGTVIRK